MHYIHLGQPSHAERLQTYLRATGRSIQDLEEILIAFVDEMCPKAGGKLQFRILCERAVETLGGLHSEAALPSLKAVAQTEDNVLRIEATTAMANVGTAEMLAFADAHQDQGRKLTRQGFRLDVWRCPRLLEIEVLVATRFVKTSYEFNGLTER